MNWNSEGWIVKEEVNHLLFEHTVLEQCNFHDLKLTVFYSWYAFAPCPSTVAIWRKKEEKKNG